MPASQANCTFPNPVHAASAMLVPRRHAGHAALANARPPRTKFDQQLAACSIAVSGREVRLTSQNCRAALFEAKQRQTSAFQQRSLRRPGGARPYPLQGWLMSPSPHNFPFQPAMRQCQRPCRVDPARPLEIPAKIVQKSRPRDAQIGVLQCL